MNILSSILNRKPAGEKTAVFGDIHSNLEALDAVIADMKQQGVTRFLCTGDIIGYGADPSACIQRLVDLNAAAVKGNHDDYCAGLNIPPDVNSNARDTIIWTEKQLSTKESIWLLNLPMLHETEGIAITHSSFEPGRNWPYILRASDAIPSLDEQPQPLAFYGHTHRPVVFTLSPTGKVKEREFRTHRLKKGFKTFINPGSVGQPRDGDPRAAYALVDPARKTVTLRRIEYDIDKTASKISKAGLPFRNSDRLYLGK